MQKSNCCIPEAEDLQSKREGMQHLARSKVEVPCPWRAYPVRMACVVFVTWETL